MASLARILKGTSIVISVVEELLVQANATSAVSLYCMTTLVASMAAESGLKQFAGSLEKSLESLLSALPRDQQRQALKLAYEIAVRDTQDQAEPARPKLRLVYSR